MRPLASVQEISSKKKFCEWVGKVEVLAILTSKGIKVFSGMCPHQGGPLESGELTGDLITCPWHGCTFDTASGQCRELGTCHNVTGMHLQEIPFSVREGMVYVDLPS